MEETLPALTELGFQKYHETATTTLPGQAIASPVSASSTVMLADNNDLDNPYSLWDMHEKYSLAPAKNDECILCQEKIAIRHKIALLYQEILSAHEKSISSELPNSPQEYLSCLYRHIDTCTQEILTQCNMPMLALATHKYLSAMSFKLSKLNLKLFQDDTAAYRAMFDFLYESTKTFHHEIKPNIRPIGTIYFLPWDTLKSADIFSVLDTEYAITKLNRVGLDPIHNFKIYLSERVGYKGGFTRTLLKMYLHQIFLSKGLTEAAHQLHRGLQGEIPLNDIDAIAPEITGELIEKMGVDQTGIEVYVKLWGKSFLAGLLSYLDNRDTTFNELLLIPKVGIYITEKCIKDTIRSVVVPAKLGRDAFGTNSYFLKIEGETFEFLGQRSFYRFINPVLGGYLKIGSQFVRDAKFDKIQILPYQIIPEDLGIYWMVLLRKNFKKPDGATRLVQIHDFALQIGSTKTNDPIEWWQEQMGKYSFFRLNDAEFDEVKVLLWFTGKIFRYSYKELRGLFGLSDKHHSLRHSKLKELKLRDKKIIAYLDKNQQAIEEFTKSLFRKN